ncbi:MAG TPA: GNAT family N-acetyltransferase [Solirubrobacteraceae bacterium]|nr:GNAT family N-acetyltransferase [Solirubrobacteraceae bacterium]
MTAPDATPETFLRVLEFQRRSIELCAEEVHEIEEGWVVRTPALPEVWSLNHLRLVTEVTPDRTIELCQAHLGGTGFHHVIVEHEAAALRLGQALPRAGWEVDVELHSVLAHDPDRDTDTSLVVEPEEEEALGLVRRWLAEDETLHLDREGLRQVVESDRLTWRARQARRLGVREPDGRLVGLTLVFSDGPVAQVETVYVIPEARGRGYARALVTRAAGLARGEHELTFIVADDNDWPKELYARLGFDPVGRTWLLHHPLNRGKGGQ